MIEEVGLWEELNRTLTGVCNVCLHGNNNPFNIFAFVER